jgi:hypothetical protein
VRPAETPYRDLAAAETAVAAGDLPAAELLLVRSLDLMPDLGPACSTLIEVENALGQAAAARGRIAACADLVRREAP